MNLYFWRYIIPDAGLYTEKEPYYELQKIISTASAVVWCESYYQPGSMSIRLAATPELLEFFWDLDLIVTRDDTDRAMIVEEFEMESGESGDYIRISGKSAEGFTDRRIIMQQGAVTMNAVAAITYYVQENLGAWWYYHADDEHPHGVSVQKSRRYFNLFDSGPTNLVTLETISAEPFGRVLGDFITEICTGLDFGFKVVFEDGRLFYSCYKGLDRTLNQSDRNSVVFSEEFQNLSSSTYTRSVLSFYSHVVAGGSGKGTQRQYNEAYTGFRNQYNIGGNMRERFINASGTDDSSLKDVALNAVLASQKHSDFNVDASSSRQFQYRKDYFLGDRVSVVNRFGVSGTATVSEVVESEDVNGFLVIPKLTQFEYGDYSVPERPQAEHYGLKIQKNNSDPSARCEYLFDAAGFTPARMDYSHERFDIGSWGNAFFVKNNYPVMCRFDGTEDYRIDPENKYSKLDGTASDINNLNYQGNAMSCFDCHIWMKFYEDENYQYLEIANKKLDDDFVDYPYIRADGTKARKLYYPMFPGYVDSNGRLRSMAGIKATGRLGIVESVQYASNNGANWFIGDWSHQLWISCMMLMISKSFNSQECFGNGNMWRGNYATASDFNINGNGLRFTKGQFGGWYSDGDPMEAFYCENIYSNAWRWVLGLYWTPGGYRVKMSPPYTHDGTLTGYESVTYPAPFTGGGYIKDLAFDKQYGILPKSVTTYNPSQNIYTCDYGLINPNVVQPCPLYVSGSCNNGVGAGAWFMVLNQTVSEKYSLNGASVYLTDPS